MKKVGLAIAFLASLMVSSVQSQNLPGNIAPVMYFSQVMERSAHHRHCLKSEG